MSIIKKLIQANGEFFLGSWASFCIPLREKNQIFGKLIISNEHVYFESRFNNSLNNLLIQVSSNIIVSSDNSIIVSQEIVRQWQDNGYITIPKSEIKDIIERKSFFKKTVTIILSDDNEYLFNRGILSVSKIAETIKK